MRRKINNPVPIKHISVEEIALQNLLSRLRLPWQQNTYNLTCRMCISC